MLCRPRLWKSQKTFPLIVRNIPCPLNWYLIISTIGKLPSTSVKWHVTNQHYTAGEGGQWNIQLYKEDRGELIHKMSHGGVSYSGIDKHNELSDITLYSELLHYYCHPHKYTHTCYNYLLCYYHSQQSSERVK